MYRPLVYTAWRKFVEVRRARHHAERKKVEPERAARGKGTLQGYHVREYVLSKWHRRCCYCGATGVPLQLEHITPKARGGSDRVSNLALACEACNGKKGTQTAAEFGYPQVQAQAKRFWR